MSAAKTRLPLAIHRVGCNPNAGINQKPAASEPETAPTVLTAYTRLKRAAAARAGLSASDSASGNAAPRHAAVGTTKAAVSNAPWANS